MKLSFHSSGLRVLGGIAMAALILLAPASAQEMKAVTGTATYAERSALPPQTVFEVMLEDITRAGAPPLVIGRTRMEEPGQPPFHFTILYDPAQIVDGRIYGVRARLTTAGVLLFTTDQSYLVLTPGHSSQVEMTMRRSATGSANRVMEKREVTGIFRYTPNAPTFTECGTGKRLPVSMEGTYPSLEAAYLRTRRQPGEELLGEVEGRIAMRPAKEGGPPVPTLVLTRYIGLWPGESCETPNTTMRLQDTYWKLTRIDNRPVLLAEKQREPSLVFRSPEYRVTGFSGCNNLTGEYKQNGDLMTIGPVAMTRMACVQGMDTEAAFVKALEKVRRWRITGQHLELYDAGSSVVARFEARPMH